MQQFVKQFVYHFLSRNAPHFYGLPLDLCGKRTMVFFVECAVLFDRMSHNSADVTHFYGKSATILGLRCSTRRHIFKKYGACRGISRCMNNHTYRALFKIQERKSDRRSKEIKQRKESQNTHTHKTRACDLNLLSNLNGLEKYIFEIFDKNLFKN